MEEDKKSYSFVDKRGDNKPEEPPAKTENQKKEEPEKKETLQKPGNKDSQDLNNFPMQIDLATLVMSFATSAIVAMGRAPDPHSGQVIKDLGITRQNIEIISLLNEKTKGNRTKEEDALFENVLYELRMLFVEAMKGDAK